MAPGFPPSSTAATEAALADPVPAIQSIKPFKPSVNDPAVVADLRARLAQAIKRFSSTTDSSEFPPWNSLPSDTPAPQKNFEPEFFVQLLRAWEQLDLDDFQSRVQKFQHFQAQIDWCELHFVHRRSSRPDAIPLLFLHGWPGSWWEAAEIIDRLAEPEDPSDAAFHVVVPSLPGYVWSSAPPSVAHYVGDVYGYGRILNALMVGLGYGDSSFSSSTTEEHGSPYTGYAVQGGDWGSIHARVVAAVPGSKVRAVHLNLCPAGPPGVLGSITNFLLDNTSLEFQLWIAGKVSPEAVATVKKAHSLIPNAVYYHMQGQRPGQLMYGLLDSPSALLAYVGPLMLGWIQDQPTATSTQGLTVTKLLELVTMYWVSGCIATSFLPYAVNDGFRSYVSKPSLYIQQPFGYSSFPYDIFNPPAKWIAATGNLDWACEAERGGHFPHIEYPEQFVSHLRSAFGVGGKIPTSVAGKPLVQQGGLWDAERKV